MSKHPLRAPTAVRAYVRGRSLASTKCFNGGLLSFLSTGADTAGRSALIEYRGHPGQELLPHTHEWEHTTYFVLEGELKFHCAKQVQLVNAGEMAFAPQGAPHALCICSPSVRLLMTVQAAGESAVGFDRFMLAAAVPATSLELPTHARAYTTDAPEYTVRLGVEYGIRILTTQETAAALPHYFADPRFLLNADEPVPEGRLPRKQRSKTRKLTR